MNAVEQYHSRLPLLTNTTHMTYTETAKFQELIKTRNEKLKDLYFAVHALERACINIEQVQDDADYFVRDGLRPVELPVLKAELERMLNLIHTKQYHEWFQQLITQKPKTTHP